MRKRSLVIVISAVFGLAALSAIAFIAWASMASPASQTALDALRDDDHVEVQTSQNIVFTPKAEASLVAAGSGVADRLEPVGVIFYPGGRVDYRAYAPLLREVAKGGYLVVLAPMPLNLAVFDSGAADRIAADYPMVKRWVIAGHSLGGAIATQYLAKPHRAAMAGLVLWGAYPMEDLSGQPGLRVLSVSGSLDGLSTPDKIRANVAKLPSATRFYEINGANHAQFGSYGPQQGDNPAQISAAEQRAETVRITLDFLESIGQ
jgi:pimeloyl-ACP methyl ester carboxylesterase